MITGYFIDEYDAGNQLVPMEWRALVYKMLLLEMHLITWAVERKTR